MQEKPQVAAFINFFLTYVNDEILDVGYFPASEDALEEPCRPGWMPWNNRSQIGHLLLQIARTNHNFTLSLSHHSPPEGGVRLLDEIVI